MLRRGIALAFSALFFCGALPMVFGCNTPATATSSTTTTTTTPTPSIANLQPFTDTTGTVATYTTAGLIDETSPFFQALGTNGRTCATCHQASQGMSLSAASVASLFTSSNGTDVLFDAIDGANYPTAATGDATAHSLLINNGLIRIAETLPAGTQFTITALQDPYGCAITIDPATGRQTISVYRRPLPTASLIDLSNVMWDTRETIASLTSSSTYNTGLATDLTQQMIDAVSIHQQGTKAPTASEIATILSIEEGLFTAQTTDNAAGSLSANGATGGPSNLAAQNYYPGINDAFGGDPNGTAFNPSAFTLYTAWQGSNNAQQASIARGENIFNTAPLTMIAVSGINSNNTALANPQRLAGTCTTCHDAPNVGNHSLPLPLDTGIAHIAADETDTGTINGLAQLSAPSLPIFQITGCTANGKPVTYITTDPGKALLTGQCADVSRMKVPTLRGLAARAPYFHNGSASNLTQVVNFYNARFGMNLNPQQKTDLVNFLSAL